MANAVHAAPVRSSSTPSCIVSGRMISSEAISVPSSTMGSPCRAVTHCDSMGSAVTPAETKLLVCIGISPRTALALMSSSSSMSLRMPPMRSVVPCSMSRRTGVTVRLLTVSSTSESMRHRLPALMAHSRPCSASTKRASSSCALNSMKEPGSTALGKVYSSIGSSGWLRR